MPLINRNIMNPVTVRRLRPINIQVDKVGSTVKRHIGPLPDSQISCYDV